MNTPEANQARVKTGVGNEFYDDQAKLITFWLIGGKPPKGLVLETKTYRLNLPARHRGLDNGE